MTNRATKKLVDKQQAMRRKQKPRRGPEPDCVKQQREKERLKQRRKQACAIAKAMMIRFGDGDWRRIKSVIGDLFPELRELTFGTLMGAGYYDDEAEKQQAEYDRQEREREFLRG